jgi:hypothetical protein
MIPSRLRGLACILVVSLFCCTRSGAQAPLEPTQMPARTAAYLIWRGTPAGDARKTNSLLALWDDPDLAPLRAAMFENMTTASAKDSSKATLTREEAEQYSTLLENAFVIGYISKPEAKMTASAAPPKPADHSWNGVFFVYDRTGKESLLSKAVMRMRGQEKELPKISEINLAGVPVLKVERTTGSTYWVEHGKYAASANERSVLEEVIARLEGKTAGGASLAQSEAYKEAQPHLGGGVIEFFAHLPNLKTMAPDASAQGFKITPMLEAMKLDAIHSLCGRVTLDGAKTRMTGAILGEAAPGTLFDLWGNGETSPASLSLLPPDAISYSETQFNFVALYEIFMRGVRAILPPGQQGGTAMVDSLAQSRLGMPLPEALGLLSGEFASMQLSPSMDPQKAVYMLGIRKKPETLKLMHTLFSDQLSAEHNEGDTTYLKVSLSGGQGGKGVAQWNFYHLAVTPQFILASGRAETLHELLATRSKSASSAATVPAGYQTARAAYPGKLDSVNYFDFHAIDWPGLKDRWVQETKKANAKSSAAGAQKASTSKIPDLLNNVNPQVFPKHLHFTAGASWKDAKGIHFDQWIE